MGITAEQQGFLLVLGAGLSTMLGGAFVFSKRLVNLANNKFFAGILAFAAGVMLFVSMIEIFVKSNTGFKDSNISDGDSYLYSTLTFFGGIALYLTLERIAGYIEERHERKEREKLGDQDIVAINMAEKQSREINETDMTGGTALMKSSGEGKVEIKVKTGIMLAIAICIHNIPEGLATFIAALAEPVVGASLAIGIGIHNIPEGMCVSMPVFYATGSRWKAFKAVIPCALAIPAGGALGWLIFRNDFDDRIYGVVFGMVSGMMTIICLKELLPLAVRYDLEDKITTKCLVGGMAFMAGSLVLFVY